MTGKGKNNPVNAEMYETTPVTVVQCLNVVKNNKTGGVIYRAYVSLENRGGVW